MSDNNFSNDKEFAGLELSLDELIYIDDCLTMSFSSENFSGATTIRFPEKTNCVIASKSLIDKIGNGLVVEAVAPDGIIEALSLKSRDQFALGVQWHPEWPRPINSFNEKIFKYFGKACQFYAESKKP